MKCRLSALQATVGHQEYTPGLSGQACGWRHHKHIVGILGNSKRLLDLGMRVKGFLLMHEGTSQ